MSGREPGDNYDIEIEARAEEALKSLSSAAKRKVDRFRDEHLRVRPTASFPGLKPLRGAFSQIWQLNLPNGYRLWYTVDESRRRVRIQRIGPHPRWEKRKPV